MNRNMHKKLIIGAAILAGLAAISGCKKEAKCPIQAPCVCPACALTPIPAPQGEPMADSEPAAAVPAAPEAKAGVKTRSEIDPKYLWKKDRLFASRDDFISALEAVPARIAELDGCKDFADGAELSRCMDLYFSIHTDINKLTLYSNMTNDTEPSPQAKLDKQAAGRVLSDFMTKSGDIRKSLLKISSDDLSGYISAVPELAKHESYIRNILRRADRVLSDDAERVLSLAGDNLWAEIDLNEIPSNSEDIFDAMISEMGLPTITDDAGKTVQLNLANYSAFRRSPNREVRKAAVNGLMDTLKKYEDVFAGAYIGQLKNDVLFAQARRYDTALEGYLDKDNIPVEIYTNLIDTVGRNLEPLHRYAALRKNILKLDSVHLYDMYIPLTESKAPAREYSYDEAVTLISTALAPLGEDYIQRLRQEMDPAKGSIDLLPYDGKESGAYSCSVYGIDPFILMNYQNSLDDVSTLAHELGHSMHSIYAASAQPASSYHYTMFLAEIASTTNEALLNDYLYKNAKSDAEKIDLLVDKLENIRGTIYRQTLFAEFEYLAHTAIEKGEGVNAEWLSKTYADLIKKYYGPDYTMEGNDDHEWAYIPHFYYKYYVYSYATGLSSALSFASLIEQSPENAVKYIDMLKGGSARPSVEMLRDAGIDLSTPAPIEFALKSFNDTLTELEGLLKAAPSQAAAPTAEDAGTPAE